VNILFRNEAISDQIFLRGNPAEEARLKPFKPAPQDYCAFRVRGRRENVSVEISDVRAKTMF
jgi:hypothetical protein